MRKAFRLLLAFLILVGSTTTFVPEAQAIGQNEVGTSYYDACMEVIYEEVRTCGGTLFTWGTSPAGAVYKNRYTSHCDTGAYNSTWYVWNGSGWTPLSSMPQPNC